MVERYRTKAEHLGAFTFDTQFYTEPKEKYRLQLIQRREMWDEEHPWYAWRKVQQNPRSKWTGAWDVGGNMTSTRTWISSESPIVTLRYFPYQGKYLYNFTGPLIPGVSPVFLDSVRYPFELPKDTDGRKRGYDIKIGDSPWRPFAQLMSEEEIAQLGSTTLSRVAPTAPHNSVFTTLGELRNDGLPSIPGLGFLRTYRRGGRLPEYSEALGGEYLNYQFGLVPTYSDVKSIIETTRKAEKLLKQYRRDSGRLVRRRVNYDPVTESSRAVWSTTSYPIETESGYFSSVGPTYRETKTTVKQWFSGAFQYFVHDDSTSAGLGYLEQANHLYGIEPTPSALYNLTPWSWLLDWFTNTGDVLENVSLYLQDPMLLRWGYVMQHSLHEVTYTQQLRTNQGRAVTADVTFHQERKIRRKVTPFHFGLTDSELDARQWSILAALGLTKFSNPGSM